MSLGISALPGALKYVRVGLVTEVVVVAMRLTGMRLIVEIRVQLLDSKEDIGFVLFLCIWVGSSRRFYVYSLLAQK